MGSDEGKIMSRLRECCLAIFPAMNHMFLPGKLEMDFVPFEQLKFLTTLTLKLQIITKFRYLFKVGLSDLNDLAHLYS